MNHDSLPRIIQGGMGAGVSGWRLARAVSAAGQLGVVSGTGLDVILTRRLQVGDPGGNVRRALDAFPLRESAQRILETFFIPGGKHKNAPFKPKPIGAVKPSRCLEELLVASNFVEVFLAKEGHANPVGINYLEKIQLPTLPSIYGAMLAGVDWVLMGAGIPRAIPGILDAFADGQPAELSLNVVGATGDDRYLTRFDPRTFLMARAPALIRPKFVAIISSTTLATMLNRRANGQIDGFVLEGPTAGGHNAPPRGPQMLSDSGEPIYGERDAPDLEALRALGVPFWLAGSCASPEALGAATKAGAAGVQVGTAFAYCDESDLERSLKQRVLAAVGSSSSAVFTDPLASPTGFPFKVVRLDGTLSDDAICEQRTRICDLGYLRHAYKSAGGLLTWRCPAEPVAEYLRKYGQEEETRGRKCICNALMANIGLSQRHPGGEFEKPLVTSGSGMEDVAAFLPDGRTTYTAIDVIRHLLREEHQDDTP